MTDVCIAATYISDINICLQFFSFQIHHGRSTQRHLPVYVATLNKWSIPFRYILRVLSIEGEGMTETELLYRWWNLVCVMEGKALVVNTWNIELSVTHVAICMKFFSYFYWTTIDHCCTHPLISPRALPFHVTPVKCCHTEYGKPMEGGDERLDHPWDMYRKLQKLV